MKVQNRVPSKIASANANVADATTVIQLLALQLREPLNILIKYKTLVIPNIEIIFISQRFD